MPKTLVIVESAAKASTIEKALGKDYVVKASNGHVKDLPRSKESVDVDNNFEPSYEIIQGKKSVINSLRTAAKKVDEVVLAPDPDREGEAISWHLAQELEAAKKPIRRITFNEITPNAIRSAMEHPREIDRSLVDAQQARRILDRLVGYRISPLLWRALRPGLSAGRVQSVAVRIILEREEEIRAFQPKEYWTIFAHLKTEKEETFTARLYRIRKEGEESEEKGTIGTYGFEFDEERANKIAQEARGAAFKVEKVVKREKRESPPAPFITSTLQQDANRKLRYPSRRTMSIAQSLYEGVDIGAEKIGLITYMRTDSTRLSPDAVNSARAFIKRQFGSEYVPSKARVYKSKKRAQDAHEAIRPTDVNRTPESIQQHLSAEQHRLYDLIWRRFVACQMSNAVLDNTTIDIRAGRFLFRATGSILRFPGYRKAYMEAQETADNEAENEKAAANGGERQPLPDLNAEDPLNLEKIEPKQSFTKPPPRYNEASLLKELEERGIGRPSTYAQIMSTIQSRDYVYKDSGRFIPTDVGELVTRMLISGFPNILDPEFTAHMENELDEVEEGKRNWVAMMRDFYDPFTDSLEEAPDKMYEERKRLEEVTEEECPECSKLLTLKWGRYGKFLGCSGYPDCKYTQPLNGRANDPEPVAPCPKCEKNHLVQRKSRRGRVFYGCLGYPDCDFAVWDPPVLDKECPECGAPFLTHRKTKTRQYYLCYNRDECGYKTDPEPVLERDEQSVEF